MHLARLNTTHIGHRCWGNTPSVPINSQAFNGLVFILCQATPRNASTKPIYKSYRKATQRNAFAKRCNHGESNVRKQAVADTKTIWKTSRKVAVIPWRNAPSETQIRKPSTQTEDECHIAIRNHNTIWALVSILSHVALILLWLFVSSGVVADRFLLNATQISYQLSHRSVG